LVELAGLCLGSEPISHYVEIVSYQECVFIEDFIKMMYMKIMISLALRPIHSEIMVLPGLLWRPF